MPRTVMILNNPTLKVATTEAGLTSGQSVECQVTSATVTATPNYQTIPATGCAGAAQSPGLTSWGLDLAWLQDWDTSGLSWFALQNDGKKVWFELTPDSGAATIKLTAEAYCSAGSYGGTFGDGSAAVATATWPLTNPPDVPTPTPPAASTLEADDAQADAPADNAAVSEPESAGL
jgi:hypothetical protein